MSASVIRDVDAQIWPGGVTQGSGARVLVDENVSRGHSRARQIRPNGGGDGSLRGEGRRGDGVGTAPGVRRRVLCDRFSAHGGFRGLWKILEHSGIGTRAPCRPSFIGGCDGELTGPCGTRASTAGIYYGKKDPFS